MKTAMQELIDELKPRIHLEWPMNKWLTNTLNRALEKEKEQIIKANIEGTEHGYRESHVFGIDARPYSEKRAEQYYNERYSGKIPPCVGHELASQDEEEANKRMDIIGQNGNEGIHYDNKD